ASPSLSEPSMRISCPRRGAIDASVVATDVTAEWPQKKRKNAAGLGPAASSLFSCQVVDDLVIWTRAGVAALVLRGHRPGRRLVHPRALAAADVDLSLGRAALDHRVDLGCRVDQRRRGDAGPSQGSRSRRSHEPGEHPRMISDVDPIILAEIEIEIDVAATVV